MKLLFALLHSPRCSSLALDRDERRDEKKRLDHLKQDQTIKEDDHMIGVEVCVEMLVMECHELDVVFDGAFGGVGDEEVVVGECVLVDIFITRDVDK
ncbi:hypothetical protein Tco_0473911 [Tanacetum coccineum]